MIWSFILGAVAGLVTPMAEPYVRRALEQVALSKIPVSETEMDVVTIVVLLIIASLLTFGASALPLLIGALVGVVGKHMLGGGRPLPATARKETSE